VDIIADRIKGIVVEIGGDTQGLDKALKGVNDTSRDLQKELRDVQKLLKFDPNNAELLAQRQQLLNEQVANTSEKLQHLKDVQAQVQQQFERGDLGADQYRAFQRELQDTESYLRNTQNALQDLENEQQAQGRSTQQLNQLFEASGRTLEEFADVVGTRTVRAIQQGTALIELHKHPLVQEGTLVKFVRHFKDWNRVHHPFRMSEGNCNNYLKMHRIQKVQ
jgi:phage-related minor tail protein